MYEFDAEQAKKLNDYESWLENGQDNSGNDKMLSQKLPECDWQLQVNIIKWNHQFGELILCSYLVKLGSLSFDAISRVKLGHIKKLGLDACFHRPLKLAKRFFSSLFNVTLYFAKT